MSAAEENWDTEIDSMGYHSLRLAKENIKIVDDARSFDEFINKGLKEVTIVGIDSEWKPSFSKETSLKDPRK